MKLKTCLILLLLVSAISCGVASDPVKPNDQANIQGTWLAQTESQNGVKKNVSYQYIIGKDSLSFIDETGKEMKYSFTLDTTGNPKLLIIRTVDTLTNATPVGVAYVLNGDSLTIVVAPSGLRPREISDKNDQELIICRRK